MRTSGLFTTCCYTIQVKSTNDDIFIVPFSDIHYGSRGFCPSSWGDFARWGNAHPNAYYIGNGDYLDSFRAHSRDTIQKNLEAEEQDVIHEGNMKRLGEFERLMGFMAGRLIGVGDGNHDWNFRDGRNTAEIIAHDFGAEYLGVMSAIRIEFEYHGCSTSILYVQHHGKPSSAFTAGGKFNGVERMARSYDADIIATGDDHKKGITGAQTRIKFMTDTHGNLVPKEYTPMLVRTGGFLRMLMPGVAAYTVDKNYAPLSLGVNAVRVKINRGMVDGNRTLRVKLGAYDIM